MRRLMLEALSCRDFNRGQAPENTAGIVAFQPVEVEPCLILCRWRSIFFPRLQKLTEPKHGDLPVAEQGTLIRHRNRDL